MKLRIQGNALRFRLTQKEVARLHDGGLVESVMQFPMGRALTYSVGTSPAAAGVTADYQADAIRVVLPRATALAWAEGDQVSIEGSAGATLQILVEKDFQCLHKPGERDPDAYPNPLAVEK